MEISIDPDNYILSISEANNELISVDIIELAEKVHKNSIDKVHYKTIENIEDMTFDIEKDNINIRIIFNSINGDIDANNEKTNLSSTEFLLLIDRE